MSGDMSADMSLGRPPYLPGDRGPRHDRARMIRVDQAGWSHWTGC